jgi:hypothetical protein
MIIRKMLLLSCLMLGVSSSLLAQRHAYELALHRQGKTIPVFASIDAAPITTRPTIHPVILDQFIAERSDQWIGTNATWRAVDSLQYDYDINGVLLNVKIRLPEDGMWPFDQRVDFDYHADGLLVQATESSWLNNNWQNIEGDQRVLWTYNEAEQINSKVDQVWREGTWENDYRQLYTYDYPGGNIITLIGQSNVAGVWENDFQLSYTEYDDQGNLLTEEQFDWLSDTWEPTVRILRSYTPQYELDELTVITFIENNWQTAYRRTYQYDNNGNLLQWLQESWLEEEQLWRAFFQELYERDDQGHLIMLISQSWNTSDNIWRNVLKTDYEYDTQNNNTLTFSQRWNSILQTWENYFRTFLYYGDGLTNIPEVEPSSIITKVYPNPTQDQLVIEYSEQVKSPITINIWSITGQPIQSLSVNNNSEGVLLSVSNLPAGSYVLEIVCKGQTATHHIQVVK